MNKKSFLYLLKKLETGKLLKRNFMILFKKIQVFICVNFVSGTIVTYNKKVCFGDLRRLFNNSVTKVFQQ